MPLISHQGLKVDQSLWSWMYHYRWKHNVHKGQKTVSFYVFWIMSKWKAVQIRFRYTKFYKKMIWIKFRVKTFMKRELIVISIGILKPPQRFLKKIISKYPNDVPSKVYFDRCTQLIERCTTEGWDFIQNITEK